MLGFMCGIGGIYDVVVRLVFGIFLFIYFMFLWCLLEVGCLLGLVEEDLG